MHENVINFVRVEKKLDELEKAAIYYYYYFFQHNICMTTQIGFEQ